MEKPILAAINGVAAGAGLSLALACDLRYAAESARLVVAFVKIGLVPDAGLDVLPAAPGRAGQSVEMSWTGDPDRRRRRPTSWAWSTRCCQTTRCSAIPRRSPLGSAHGPATTLALIKRAVNQSHELPLERVLELEANYQTIAAEIPTSPKA